MLRGYFIFFIVTTVLTCCLAIDSSTLKCSDLRQHDKLICVVFDLQIYHEMTKIKEIDDGMYGLKFDALYLMSPLVYYLPTNIFSHFPNITELKIITDIPALLELESTFKSLNQLETIQITNQKLKKLDEEEFQGAKKVTSLYLASNEIERIHDDAFLGLEQCKFLDLRNNRLRVIRMEVLRHMPKLWSVNFGNNRLFSIFSNLFEGSSIAVADFSYNLVRTVESIAPIERVLKGEDGLSLFSLRYQLCKRFGSKAIFTPKSITPQIQSRIDACQSYYTLPGYCHELISEESEGDYDENDDWDGGVFGEAVPLPTSKPNTKLADEYDTSYELATLKAENMRLKSFCMSGNFPGDYRPVAQTCSSKINSIASVVSSVQNLLNNHQSSLQVVIEKLQNFSQEHAEGTRPLKKPLGLDVNDIFLTTKESESETTTGDSLEPTDSKPEETGDTTEIFIESTSLEADSK